jgi:hypothetical protein
MVESYEKFYNQYAKKVTKCPVTGQEGQPEPDNPLVWRVKYIDNRGQKRTSRWSYTTGRIVSAPAADTNVL